MMRHSLNLIRHPMEFNGKKILVIGAGKTGIAAAHFLAGKKAEVELTDRKDRNSFHDALVGLEKAGVNLILGRYPSLSNSDYKFVVVSPGVSLNEPPIVEAFSLGLPVISEVELAYYFCTAPLIAITGTNGKTTTTALVGDICQEAEIRTLVAGNIGLPLITKIEDYKPQDIIVAEVSSFQLETTHRFRPKVAVILNITPDHLDRHGNMKAYISSKALIFANQTKTDFTVLNYDDPLTAKFTSVVPGKVIFFSRQHKLEKGVFVQEEKIMARVKENLIEICKINEIKIPGAHNLENALAAVAATLTLGIDYNSIARALKSFPGVAHRLEFVEKINGIWFINDSKGTNPNASIKALETFQEPIILIAGGKNKDSNFEEFVEKIKEKVRLLIVLGQSAPLIEKVAREKNFNAILQAKDLRAAVQLAYQAAQPGEIVLLSPACASWDMFNNFEERGNLFKELVLDLRR